MLLLYHSNGDQTVIQLRFNLDKDNYLDVLVGSIYMPYDSQAPQKRIKVLVLFL